MRDEQSRSGHSFIVTRQQLAHQFRLAEAVFVLRIPVCYISTSSSSNQTLKKTCWEDIYSLLYNCQNNDLVLFDNPVCCFPLIFPALLSQNEVNSISINCQDSVSFLHFQPYHLSFDLYPIDHIWRSRSARATLQIL